MIELRRITKLFIHFPDVLTNLTYTDSTAMLVGLQRITKLFIHFLAELIFVVKGYIGILYRWYVF